MDRRPSSQTAPSAGGKSSFNLGKPIQRQINGVTLCLTYGVILLVGGAIYALLSTVYAFSRRES